MNTDFAQNSYTRLRSAGLTPEYASKLAAEWAIADLEVTEWAFAEGEFLVTLSNGNTVQVYLGGPR